MGHATWRRGSLFAIAAAALPMGAANRAAAANVTWRGPPSCSDRASVVEEAGRLLGRPLDAVDSVDFEVVVNEADDGRWTLSLHAIERFTGERRSREFTGKSCGEVADTAAVAMAMTIESGQTQSSVADRTSAQPSAAAPEKPAPVPSEERSKNTTGRVVERQRQVRFSLAAAGVVDVGALPSIAPGVDVGASIGYRALRVTAFGEAFFSQQTREPGGKGGEFELLVGGLLGCGTSTISTTAVFACLGAEGGRLSGAGVGVRTPRSGESPWWAPRADAGVLVPIGGRFSLLARISATLPLVRREFVLDETITVHRPGAVTGRALFGIEFGIE